MDTGDTRPLSDHEFATTVARATARLHGSVQRLDDGDDLALDDLANILRLPSGRLENSVYLLWRRR